MDLRPDSDYWIGLYKETATAEGTTYWLDGNPSTYRWWAGDAPDEATQCVEYTPLGFRDRDCSDEYQYICKGMSYSHSVYYCKISVPYVFLFARCRCLSCDARMDT